MTNDLQQKMSNLSRTAPAPEASQMTFQELLDNEQLILNENKLLEVNFIRRDYWCKKF